jgi:hypothetical protein
MVAIECQCFILELYFGACRVKQVGLNVRDRPGSGSKLEPEPERPNVGAGKE